MTQGGQPRGLRLALVSAYPPSIGPLSEYCWHLVESLRRSDRVAELHVLADRAPGAVPTDDGAPAMCGRAWTFDGLDLPVETLRAGSDAECRCGLVSDAPDVNREPEAQPLRRR